MSTCPTRDDDGTCRCGVDNHDAKKRRRIEIIEDATGKVVNVIETDYTGVNYAKLLDGLNSRVDWDHFTVREDTDPPFAMPVTRERRRRARG